MVLFDAESYNCSETGERTRVRELVSFERYCRDYEQWVEMKNLFLRDSRVQISWFDGDGHDFVEASRKMLGASHNIHNIIVKISNDKAVAEMMTEIQSRTEIDGVACDLVSHVRLLYRLLKPGNDWSILSIDCIYVKDSIVPAIPAPMFSMNYDELDPFRSSYRCLCFFLNKMGKKINNELPGVDRPETVTALYDKYGIWLNQK
jgi:hypothetical protein